MFDKSYFDNLPKLLRHYFDNWIIGHLSIQLVTTHGTYLLAGNAIDADDRTITLPYHDDARSKLARNRNDPDHQQTLALPAVTLPYEAILALHLLPRVPKSELDASGVTDGEAIGFRVGSSIAVGAR